MRDVSIDSLPGLGDYRTGNHDRSPRMGHIRRFFLCNLARVRDTHGLGKRSTSPGPFNEAAFPFDESAMPAV
jgi:hypothetical protein